MIKIAVLGLGTVGTGVVKILQANQEQLCRRAGQPLAVKAALVRSLRGGPYGHLMTDRFSDIEADPEIAVVVETMGGVGAAYGYTRRCLMAGKHVVTANKQLVAQHGQELLELARRCGVQYLFEASVGGGIPVLHVLTQCLSVNRIDEICGVLNGTSNFILTRMIGQGLTFCQALKLAQKKGYAEADPAADVDGLDTGRKIAILADLAFGRQTDPGQVPVEGIGRLERKDVKIAWRSGYRIKLLGRCLRLEGGRRTAYVAPHLVGQGQFLAGAEDVCNAVTIRGNAVGEVTLCGPGAGELPTASACVSDVIECLRTPLPRPEIGWSADGGGFVSPAEVNSRWYLRISGGGGAALPEGAQPLPAGRDSACLLPPMPEPRARALAAGLGARCCLRLLE